MGQIYICGAFSHAPNQLSRANSSTLVQPLPHPQPIYDVGHVYTLFLQSFNIVFERGGGGKQRILKRITVLFENLKTQKINAITQVSQGILSTIVVKIVQIGLNKSMNKGTKSIRPLTSITGNINTLIHSG